MTPPLKAFLVSKASKVRSISEQDSHVAERKQREAIGWEMTYNRFFTYLFVF